MPHDANADGSLDHRKGALDHSLDHCSIGLEPSIVRRMRYVFDRNESQTPAALDRTDATRSIARMRRTLDRHRMRSGSIAQRMRRRPLSTPDANTPSVDTGCNTLDRHERALDREPSIIPRST